MGQVARAFYESPRPVHLLRSICASTGTLTADATAIVLAGGRGERLHPLTRDRAKPAVPFGGAHRIIDFTIANCVRSGVPRVHVLTQYQSASIEHHIRRAWRPPALGGAQIGMRASHLSCPGRSYLGTADAVFRNLDLVERTAARFVLVLGGDHVYGMNYEKLLVAHVQSGAEMTIAATEVALPDARRMGVLAVDERWRVRTFEEKPPNPKPLPGEPDAALASMGIYVFRREALLRELRTGGGRTDDYDFGRHVIPAMVRAGARVYASPFRDTSGRPQYWRDIGTLDSYHEASMDLVDKRARVSFIAPSGWSKSGATIKRSILGFRTAVEMGALVDQAVLFDGVRVGRGAHVRRAILDEGVEVADGARVGLDLDEDRRRFTVTEGGVVVVPRGTVVEP